jgi:hypothetical protein
MRRLISLEMTLRKGPAVVLSSLDKKNLIVLANADTTSDIHRTGAIGFPRFPSIREYHLLLKQCT